jgi:hypothetical protein
LSERDDDLELEALQRRLDDAFETTRPRRGFEDDLWTRMQARRPFGARLRDGFAALLGTIREVPAVPAATVAVVLVLAVGLGVLTLGGGLHFGNQSTTSASLANPAAGSADRAAGLFGPLPPVAFYAGTPAPAYVNGQPVTQGSAPTVNLYLGPANLVWTGQLPASIGLAPVYRFQNPGSADADKFAASLGAASAKSTNPAAADLGYYQGQAFTLVVSAGSSAPPREPRFLLTPTGTGASSGDPQSIATAFLAAHSLAPTWPNTISVVNEAGRIRVELLREFPLGDGSTAYLISFLGEREGIDVVIENGQVVNADGPVPLSLDTATYRTISAPRAAQLALADSGSGSPALTPKPTVNLDQVELVYALAVSGGSGYYEPAYLFSGTFQYNGQTYTKRVLVPLVDPSQRSS